MEMAHNKYLQCLDTGFCVDYGGDNDQSMHQDNW